MIKELQVASKFLEKVPDLIVEMPTADDLVVVDNIKDVPDIIEGNKEDDNIKINITEKEADEFDKEGMKKLEDEEVWDGDDDDPPMTFEELNQENDANKCLVLNLQNQVNMLKEELSMAIANMRGSGDGLLEENMQLKILLKMYL